MLHKLLHTLAVRLEASPQSAPDVARILRMLAGVEKAKHKLRKENFARYLERRK